MKLYKKLYSTRFLLLIFLSVVGVLLLSQCEESIEKFAFGEKYIDSQTSINLIDTFAVEFSTVLLDTVESSGNGYALVGSYEDDVFGKISSNSYFQLGAPDVFYADTIQEDSYDSLTLILEYSGYFFGDSLEYQTLEVHQLLENIEVDDDDDTTFTTKTTFEYDPNPIGSITYLPRPNSDPDTINIALDDAFGHELYELMKNDTSIFDDDDDFVDYFHGLVLTADNGMGIVGFDASSTDLRMVLYTTSNHDNKEKKLKYTFPLYNDDMQFNNIESDLSATSLASLSEQMTALPSEDTDGLAYLQGGTGLAIRVDIPSLENLLLLDIDVIQKVELIFSPLPGTYTDFALPPTLLLYECGEDNYVTSSSEVAQSELSVIDYLLHENTTYTFDITDYVAYYFSNSYFDPDVALLMKPASYYLNSTFYRLVTDNPQTEAKLKIYFLSY